MMRLMIGASVLASAVVAIGLAQGTPTPAGTLAGTIDVHVHSYPDDRPRSIHAIDVAKLAKSRGMRAIVLKNHYESTAGTAYLVRQVVPDLEVFGGIALNLTVGGINPAAVDHMARVTGGWGRMVWMPTFDAENQVRFSKETRPFVSVSKGGALLPEVKTVIGLFAKHVVVLETGPSAAGVGLLLLREGLSLVREGRPQGVRQIIVTHAIQAPVLMDVAQMKEAASLGAFIEFVGGSPEGQGAAARMDGIAAAIRQVGVAPSILSSDLGQQGNPLPPDGFGAFIEALRTRGFSDRDLDVMAKAKPARLVGLVVRNRRPYSPAFLERYVPITPSSGLLAVAYIFRGIRPERNASRPAMTACFMASAMATGFSAPAMAVFIRTPSAPSSIARAASDAVPPPAATITGTLETSRMMRMLLAF